MRGSLGGFGQRPEQQRQRVGEQVGWDDARLGEFLQLGIEYDPQPPFDAGSPSKAPSPIVEAVTAVASRSAMPG